MSAKAADPRLQQATAWARDVLGDEKLRIEPLSGDASFRRYFRIRQGDECHSLLLMDTPPHREDPGPFLDVDRRLRNAGLPAPEIFHFDQCRGFGIIEDFGDVLYREVLDESSAPMLFPQLFEVLEQMAGKVLAKGLPLYDRGLLQDELDLFPEWYLARHRHRHFSRKESECWQAVCELLIENAELQPQVFVHRDFHSCNLIFRDGRAPGIIDFQDAVRGPVSYDFISLIWDRYIPWPRPQLETWMSEVHQRLAPDVDFDAWVRHCDLMGLQRNLKVVGIFARLRYRDQKQGYLEMIPMFYRYLLDVFPGYPEFDTFLAILEDESCAP